MRWLTECSRASLSEALRVVAPQLSGLPIEMGELTAKADPQWWSSTATLGGQFIAKFAWSRPAAQRVAHELDVLTALTVPYRPEVVAASTDPLLFVTRRVPGSSLFDVIHSIDRDHAGRQLAEFLAALHHPATRARVEAAVGQLPDAQSGPQHPASTSILRDRLDPWVRPDQRDTLRAWYDWADAALAPPRSSVLVHADLHGDNQVWTGDRLRLVVDFETVSAAEPEYDFRAFPTTELLTATMRHYRQITDHEPAVDRILAWHIRSALGDALWRSEAGIPLPDRRTPAAWVDDLSTRFRELGVSPHNGGPTGRGRRQP